MAGVAGRSGGRNARTTQEHQQRGSYRDDRHGGSVNPNPPKGAPTPPKTLGGEAKAEWDRMISRLTESRTLSTVDDGALYQYCQLFAETEALPAAQAEALQAMERLEDAMGRLEGGELVQCVKELVKLRQLESRYIGQIRQQRMALRVYLVEFGLTPAARSRVKVGTPDEPENPWDGLVN